jgi:ABC-type uncharacterized transport system auxiliary subunit
MLRRSLLLLPLAGCSVVPERPYREVRRFALAPERPAPRPAPAGGPVLLLRAMRAAPGLEGRGLRSVSAAGQVTQEFLAEWAAPPAELAEEALRRWLQHAGVFSAVTAPGSRLRAGLVLEAELLALHVEPAGGQARAGMAALLLAEDAAQAGARVLAQLQVAGAAPLSGTGPEHQAAAMAAALAAALAALEARLVQALPRR